MEENLSAEDVTFQKRK